MLDVCLLGTGGMMPLHNRWLSSMLLRFNGKMILIDCGEGTQIPFRQAGWGVRNLEAICFTHYHADHIAGLPGLLLTLGNSGRIEPLVLIGPKGLEYIVKSLTVIAHNLPFQIVFVPICENDFPFYLGDFVIKYHEVDHNVNCTAYSVEILRSGKFDVEKAKANNVPLKLWNQLQKGKTAEHDGVLYTNDMVLGKQRRGLKVSYCTDSRPVDTLAEFAMNSDLFVCEGMYGDDELMIKAQDKKHMTFREAANIAKNAKVKELWLTHFSPSMTFPREYLNNAKKVFENTFIGQDLMIKTLFFDEE
jgi:ribonuclease Z